MKVTAVERSPWMTCFLKWPSQNQRLRQGSSGVRGVMED